MSYYTGTIFEVSMEGFGGSAADGTVNPLSNKMVTILSKPMEKPHAGVSIPVNFPIILS